MRRKHSTNEPPKHHQIEEQCVQDEKPRTGGLKDLDNYIGRFSTQVTSAHGLAHIYTAKNIVTRMIWTLIVLIAAGTFIWQMHGLITRFIRFDTNTEVREIIRQRITE